MQPLQEIYLQYLHILMKYLLFLCVPFCILFTFFYSETSTTQCKCTTRKKSFKSSISMISPNSDLDLCARSEFSNRWFCLCVFFIVFRERQKNRTEKNYLFIVNCKVRPDLSKITKMPRNKTVFPSAFFYLLFHCCRLCFICQLYDNNLVAFLLIHI